MDDCQSHNYPTYLSWKRILLTVHIQLNRLNENASYTNQTMRTLRGKGLLTEVEFCKAKECLVDRYNPIWGHLPDVVA